MTELKRFSDENITSQFHCMRCGLTEKRETIDGHIIYSDGICAKCLDSREGGIFKRLSDDDEAIEKVVQKWAKGDWRKTAALRHSFIEVTKVGARAAEDERDRQWIEWSEELCDCPKNEPPTNHPHPVPTTKRHDCGKCWQSLKQKVEEASQ